MILVTVGCETLEAILCEDFNYKKGGTVRISRYLPYLAGRFNEHSTIAKRFRFQECHSLSHVSTCPAFRVRKFHGNYIFFMTLTAGSALPSHGAYAS